MSLKKLENGKWQVRYRDEHRKQRARNFKNQERARDFLRKLQLGEVRQGAEMLFGDFADRWLRDYSRLEKAPSQFLADESRSRIYLKPALGHMKLGQLTRARLEDFRRALREKTVQKTGKPLSTKSVNLVLAQLKRMISVAVDWELLSTNPGAGVKLFTQPQQDYAHWSVEERDYFLRFARQHDEELAQLVLIAVHTGLRRGELAGLFRNAVNFDKRVIRVSASYCFHSKQLLSRTKSGRIGYVPMRDEVYQALLPYKLSEPIRPIFRPEAFRHITQRLKRVCRRVGVRPLRFHDLRHTFASCLVSDGVPLYTVQRLMRHETIQMTQRYAHLSLDDLRAAMGVVHESGTEDARVLTKDNDSEGIYGAATRI